MTAVAGVKVLVTGGFGFLGTQLSEQLEALGAHVWRATSSRHGNETEREIRGDLRDPVFCQRLIQVSTPALIFHAAGTVGGDEGTEAIDRHIQGNVITTGHLLEAVASKAPNSRVVVVSSAAVYGAARPPTTERAPFAPLTPYGVSKVGQEMLAMQQHLARGTDVVRVRPFNLIGPAQPAYLLIPELCMQIALAERAGGGDIRVGNLSPRRDFVDVRDAARALVALGSTAPAGSVFNVATGEPHSVEEVVSLLFDMAGGRFRPIVDPTKVRPVDVDESYGDIAKLVEATSWQPTIPLVESLRATLVDARDALSEGDT